VTVAEIWQTMKTLLRRLRPDVARRSVEARRQAESVAVPPSFVPPGHYYSPTPSNTDIEEFGRRLPPVAPLPGIDLNEAEQLTMLQELAGFYPSMPFTDNGSPGFRYRFGNPSYSYADGVFLHTMLRYLRPGRVIEVGSGYTSALTLDTNEHFLGGRVECCFIDPHPELLLSLITDEDRQRSRVIHSRLQDVDLALFDSLEAGDVLFIDSTHVSKVNSDVNYLFFEILPRLAPGTMVHIHDVFPSFEYPLDWLRAGRAWNEQYLLRAFLEFNTGFKIRLFGAHMILRHPEWFRAHMPLCLKNPGGAFWMERMS
jgi:predicted O-methyltransferase YrrM